MSSLFPTSDNFSRVGSAGMIAMPGAMPATKARWAITIWGLTLVVLGGSAAAMLDDSVRERILPPHATIVLNKAPATVAAVPATQQAAAPGRSAAPPVAAQPPVATDARPHGEPVAAARQTALGAPIAGASTPGVKSREARRAAIRKKRMAEARRNAPPAQGPAPSQFYGGTL